MRRRASVFVSHRPVQGPMRTAPVLSVTKEWLGYSCAFGKMQALEYQIDLIYRCNY
eukprot:m.301612 g.301612  ORF g.301612 m.301612 type:complete len:56 (-) comp20143_c0_seq3:1455-1622(-)